MELNVKKIFKIISIFGNCAFLLGIALTVFNKEAKSLPYIRQIWLIIGIILILSVISIIFEYLYKRKNK